MKRKIEDIIEDVMEENYYEEITDQAVRSIVNEFNSRIQLGTFKRLDGEEVETVLAGKTRDYWILQIFTEIESRDDRGIIGYGYAYNLDNPDMSEWGRMFNPAGGR